MRIWSRGLREGTIKVLSGLGLLLALTVMAFVFAVSAAQGGSADEQAVSAAPPDASSVASEPKRTDLDGSSNGPSAFGFVLGVLVLGTGVTVLALGARRSVPASKLSDVLAAE